MNRFVISKIMAITDDTFNLKEMINIFQKRKKNIKIYNDQTCKAVKNYFWINLRQRSVTLSINLCHIIILQEV
jgi:hypothetical protein